MDEATVKAAIEARIALYRKKQERRDPLGPDIASTYDLCEHAVEVLQWFAADLGIKIEEEAGTK